MATSWAPIQPASLPAKQFWVEIDGGASDNLVGTNGDGVSDASEQTCPSGNLFAGVLITGQGTDHNAVAGNLIGARISATSL